MGCECTPSLRKTVGTTPTCSRNVLLKWLNDENPTSPATWVTVSVLPRSKNLARSMRNEVSVFPKVAPVAWRKERAKCGSET